MGREACLTLINPLNGQLMTATVSHYKKMKKDGEEPRWDIYVPEEDQVIKKATNVAKDVEEDEVMNLGAPSIEELEAEEPPPFKPAPKANTNKNTKK